MDTVVPVPSTAHVEDGYYTPKGYLNQSIVKEAEAARESKRQENPRYATTSSECNVPISPSSRFPSSSPLIVISPPKDETSTVITTILPTPLPRNSTIIPSTHRRSLIVAIIAALLVVIASFFMILLVFNT